MISRFAHLLLALFLMSAVANFDGPLSAEGPPGSDEYEMAPLALKYRHQVLQVIEALWSVPCGCDWASLSSEPEPLSLPAEDNPLPVLLASDPLFGYMSLQL